MVGHQWDCRVPAVSPGPQATDLLRMRLCTTFKTTMRWVLSLRKSVSLLFSTGLVSCLAITFRLSQEALHLRSSCIRLLASSSKSTWKS